MKKVLKRVAILAAPIIWRRIRGRRDHHHGRRRWHHHSHHRFHHRGHKSRRMWL